MWNHKGNVMGEAAVQEDWETDQGASEKKIGQE